MTPTKHFFFAETRLYTPCRTRPTPLFYNTLLTFITFFSAARGQGGLSSPVPDGRNIPLFSSSFAKSSDGVGPGPVCHDSLAVTRAGRLTIRPIGRR